MGKYIIELPENTHWIQWIMESTKDHHPYMDFKQVEDLTPYTEPDTEKVREAAYQRGMETAWLTARKIICRISDGGYTQDLLDGIFGSHNCQSIMAQYSASDAVEKISKYEPEQYQIGDEVECDFGIGIITKPVEGGAYIMWKDGSSGGHTANQFRVTGRHFPEIAAVLAKMKEES